MPRVCLSAISRGGSALAYNNAQGSSTSFTGTSFMSGLLERPIGVVAMAAVPEPSTIAGVVLAIGGLGVRQLRQRRSQSLK